MTNEEDQDSKMEISINYGERDGLKSSKSRTFKVDKIVLIKDDQRTHKDLNIILEMQK